MNPFPSEEAFLVTTMVFGSLWSVFWMVGYVLHGLPRLGWP